MPTITDPARELALLCERLAAGDQRSGAEHLGAILGMQPWSREFYEALSCLLARIETVREIVSGLEELDEDLRGEAVAHLELLKNGFGLSALINPWSSVGVTHLSRENIQAVKMLSPQVRAKMAYPSLSAEELGSLIGDLDELLAWLSEHQADQHDFIRQALIEGLERLKLRLTRLGWLGWGYALESLREVIGAYLALERGLPPDGQDPHAEAILLKVMSWMKEFYTKTKLVKDVASVGEFLLKAYGAASIVAHGGSVAALLPAG